MAFVRFSFHFFISVTITSAMTIKTSNQIRLIHGDCMDYMRSLPDNAFDLAIVDPPYGIGVDGGAACHGRPASTAAGVYGAGSSRGISYIAMLSC